MPDTDILKARIRDLELALGQGNANLAITFRLTPVLNNLMGLLVAMPVVTPEMICQRLGIAPDAKVALFRLRKHIAPWEITIHSKRNVGYWIDSTDKAKVKRMLAGTVEETADIEETAGPEDEIVTSDAAVQAA
jgi:hypothetical protein